jgi:hypothetical protein
VVPGADAAEDWMPLEGAVGFPDDRTPDSTGGATVVGASDGGPLRGAVAIDSTVVTGAGGGTL